MILYNLQQEVFNSSVGHDSDTSFMEWKNLMQERSPTFFFWDMILRYEVLMLIFVRAHRERNFSLYVEVLEELVPTFLSLDHTNYARWVPIHIRDMKALPDSIKNEFKTEGHWVITKTRHAFSAIPIDQAHEQENKCVKGSWEEPQD